MTPDPGLPCQEFVELVTEYLEGNLDVLTRRRFDEHLGECPHCAEYLNQIRETRRALGRVDLEPLSAAARGQLLAAFRDWRAQRPEPGSG